MITPVKFSNKIVIISGAGSGIGQALAISFALESATVVLVGRRKEKLDKTLKEIASRGKMAYTQVCDISRKKEVVRVVDYVVEKFGRIDVLINNAGVSSIDEIVKLEEDSWNKTIGINLTGTFFFCQAAARQMILQRKGKIINVASIHAFATYPLRSAYATSKGGIVALTRSLGLELAKYGINVNCIAPGQVITENVRKIVKSGNLDLEKIKERTPLGRIAEVEDIIGPVFFLASEDSNFIVGQTLIIDGGYLINALP